MWALQLQKKVGRGRAPALVQSELHLTPRQTRGGRGEESSLGWDASLRLRNALNVPLLNGQVTFQPVGWPMTGWEKNAHHQGGEGRGEEGRGAESPAPTSLRRKLWAQLLAPAEAAPSSGAEPGTWGAGQLLAEPSGERAATPSNTEGGVGGRVQGATTPGSLRGETLMSEEQETPERKGSNFS